MADPDDLAIEAERKQNLRGRWQQRNNAHTPNLPHDQRARDILSVIPTGATRLFPAHGLCAPGRGAEGSRQKPMLSGLPLRASALVFLCEPLRTLRLCVIFFLSSLASSLSRRRSNISYASYRTWRDRQTSSQQSAPDPCPFEAGESSPCCRREPSVSLDQISRDRVSSEQPQSQVP